MNTQALKLNTLNTHGARALNDTDLEAVTGGNWLTNLGTAAAVALGIGAAVVTSGSGTLTAALSANAAGPAQESANLAG